MNTKIILIIQIVADVVLCTVVLFLLISIGKKIARSRSSAVNEKYLLEFQNLLAESQASAAGFFRTLDANCEKFKELAADLEEKEKSLTALIQEAQRKLEKFSRIGVAPDSSSSEQKYDLIMKLSGQGVSEAEMAKRSELTAGEISLIIDLERKRRETSAR
jgi:hypothetical protein